MTRGRYEIEFQGSNDGENWTPYLFRNKPQALERSAAHLCALSAALRLEPVVRVAWATGGRTRLFRSRRSGCWSERRDVLALFRDDPFPQMPPRYVRAVLWQYWFTSMDEKREHGELVAAQVSGAYAPELTMAGGRRVCGGGVAGRKLRAA